jgi:hypothetical protein
MINCSKRRFDQTRGRDAAGSLSEHWPPNPTQHKTQLCENDGPRNKALGYPLLSILMMTVKDATLLCCHEVLLPTCPTPRRRSLATAYPTC